MSTIPSDRHWCASPTRAPRRLSSGRRRAPYPRGRTRTVRRSVRWSPRPPSRPAQARRLRIQRARRRRPSRYRRCFRRQPRPERAPVPRARTRPPAPGHRYHPRHRPWRRRRVPNPRRVLSPRRRRRRRSSRRLHRRRQSTRPRPGRPHPLQNRPLRRTLDHRRRCRPAPPKPPKTRRCRCQRRQPPPSWRQPSRSRARVLTRRLCRHGEHKRMTSFVHAAPARPGPSRREIEPTSTPACRRLQPHTGHDDERGLRTCTVLRLLSPQAPRLLTIDGPRLSEVDTGHGSSCRGLRESAST